MKEERNVSGLKKGHSSRRVCCQGEKFSPCPTKAMDRWPKDGEWHSLADEVHRPAVRKLPLEWKPRRKATKEMHSFPVDSTIGGAHKRREIRSAISARLSMLCFLDGGSRLEHRTDRPTNVRSRIGVYNFEIDQKISTICTYYREILTVRALRSSRPIEYYVLFSLRTIEKRKDWIWIGFQSGPAFFVRTIENYVLLSVRTIEKWL